VRQFAQWLNGLDPAHEIPPKGLIPGRPRRPRPYIYSRMEIEKIVTAASDLSSVQGLRGLTFSTLFGLIAMPGLRIGEALALDRDDVDLDQGVLTIRRGNLARRGLCPFTPASPRTCVPMPEKGTGCWVIHHGRSLRRIGGTAHTKPPPATTSHRSASVSVYARRSSIDFMGAGRASMTFGIASQRAL
jgi:hypothetical protein